jgi:hypothetical protein
MDEKIERLETPEECESFARNVQEKHPDLARQARRKGVQLRAAAQGAKTSAEREAWAAVLAYEEVLFTKHGRRISASRTRQMIKRHGIMGAVERAVNRTSPTVGYRALVEVGMQDFAFENVVVRHPDSFSPGTVARARTRVEEWNRA